MKVGDLVTVRLGELCTRGRHAVSITNPNPSLRYTKGIILDCLEMSDGFYSYEVLFEGIVEWFSDLELEIFNDGGSRNGEDWFGE
jgi:hypothetical protein